MTKAQMTALVSAVLAVGASAYLTVEHFSSSTSFGLCPATSSVNCLTVTTSQWSRFAGMPVAVLGLVFFVAMVVLCLPPLWRIRQLDYLRIAAGVVGVAGVLYLVWAELFRIEAICLWCTVVHVLTLVFFVAVLWAAAERDDATLAAGAGAGLAAGLDDAELDEAELGETESDDAESGAALDEAELPR